MALLLSPASIAVIGASASAGKVGHDILKNLISQGYAGQIYPINPKGGEILGKKAHTSVTEVPGPIDLAVIVTPAPTVAGLLEACGTKEIRSVVVITAGFGEIGTEDGKKMEEDLKKIAKKYQIALVGPNCLGIIRTSINMNASFAKDMPPKGSVALLSQSGAFAVAIMDMAPVLHLGFSTVISMGNKTMMDECDFLELCAADPETHVIGMYLESIKDGQRFRKVAGNISRKKSIVLIKSGVTEHGRQAVSSHTGALAGSDAAIDAVCRQAGIHRAHDTGECLDLLRVLATQSPLLSPRMAIITNAGGPGILATDAAEKERLILPILDQKTQEILKPALPPAASIHNPIDVLGDAGADRYAAAIEAAADDRNIDGIVALLTPQVMTPCTEIAKAIADTHRRHALVPVVASFIGGASVEEARMILEKHGIPTFDTPERAVRALVCLRPLKAESCAVGEQAISENRQKKAQKILSAGTGLISEDATRELFALYDLPLPSQSLATNPEEAATMAESIGFPVIAKISSPDILHKTDVGGIRANLRTKEEVTVAVRDILVSVKKNMPQANIRGVLIQKLLPAGNEFIVGGLRDPSFGPLVMAGLGGIYTEFFRDTSFRLAPLCKEDAYVMLQELASWKLLLGMRGKTQSDIDGLVEIMCAVSSLMHECQDILTIDCNPVLLTEKEAAIADVKVILKH